jgi:hypothetical protein
MTARQNDVQLSTQEAQSAALAATSAANASIWVSGQTYEIGVVRFSPINFLSYRRKTAGAGTTDPSLDATNWAQVAGTGDVSITGTQILTNKTLTNPVINGLTGDSSVINFGSGQFYKDSSGNVGIGTGSPSGKLHVLSASGVQRIINEVTGTTGSDSAQIRAINGTVVTNLESFSTGGVGAVGTTSNHPFTFSSNNAERMRITASGDIVAGNTSTLNANARFSVWNSSSTGSVGIATGYGTTFGQFRLIYLNNNISNALAFDSGTNFATLSAAGAWTNASDARLKNSIVEIKYGLSTVLNTQPRSYKMNDLEGNYIGFIAQEMQEIIPEVVTGDPEKQLGIDYGSLVAVAFKAIQEQQAIITTLTARVAALESN